MSEPPLFLESSPLVGRMALFPMPFVIEDTRRDPASRAAR
jgi:hypothetical protein